VDFLIGGFVIHEIKLFHGSGGWTVTALEFESGNLSGTELDVQPSIDGTVLTLAVPVDSLPGLSAPFAVGSIGDGTGGDGTVVGMMEVGTIGGVGLTGGRFPAAATRFEINSTVGMERGPSGRGTMARPSSVKVYLKLTLQARPASVQTNTLGRS
jgi:hypothetical protein